ncbi:hypothetical protein N7535_000178 [Penicillium sp. DV-2018c]|nr:hypothetical protein N7461_006574 [Penicillium sp. DV-2018c]KAJ5581558.1 hypothetical protein N7535_000178 [Penicillium sp. DV-2018c]
MEDAASFDNFSIASIRARSNEWAVRRGQPDSFNPDRSLMIIDERLQMLLGAPAEDLEQAAGGYEKAPTHR